MSEIKLTHGEIEAVNSTRSGMNWRRWLAGIGLMLIFVDVGVSAIAKGALGELPKYVALTAVLLLAISGIAGIINSMSSKGNKTA